MTDVFQTFARVTSEHLNVPVSDVLPGRSLSDLGADSLDPVEIVLAVELEIDAEFPDLNEEILHRPINEIISGFKVSAAPAT